MYAVIDNSAEFTITFDDSNRIEKATAGTSGLFGDSYSRVRLRSTTTQVVTVVLGWGEFRDARASVNATINTTIEPSDTIDDPLDVSVGVTATQIAAADANRKELVVNVPSTATQGIRVGGATVARGAGLLVEPGTTLTLSAECAIYGITNTTTGSVDVSLIDLTRP